MTTTAKILDYISKTNGATAPELQRALNIPQGTATSRTSTLAKQGKIKAQGKKGRSIIYVLSAEGVTAVEAPEPKVVVHYEIVVDNTGSMNNGNDRKAFDLVEAQLKAVGPAEVWTFSERADLQRARFNKSFGTPLGYTRLFHVAIDAIDRAMKSPGPRVVFIFTDGLADDGYLAADLQAMLTNSKDLTLALMVPAGSEGKRQLLAAGVPAGNIREWTSIEQASKDAVVAAENFKKAVARGVRRTKNYFAADLSRILPADLESQLRDVTEETWVKTVNAETTIETFVGSRNHVAYTPGTGLFEIMKQEKNIPADRKLLILNPTTDRVYADGKRTVRSICGYPEGQDIAIKPGNHAGYVIFCQSKSSAADTFRARILPRGTRVAFWPGAVS
jgi:hypothetical protein